MRLLLVFGLCTCHAFAMSLQEAEEMALAYNPQVKASEELVRKSQQNRYASIGKWLPQIQLLTQGYRTQKPLKFFKLTKPTAFSTQLSLTQSLLSSDLYHDVRMSTLLVEEMKRLLEAARNDVLLQVRTLYYQVVLDRKKLATAKEHVELLQSLAQRMEGKYRIGEATSYNVNQAKVAMVNVTTNLYQMQQNLKSDQDELAQVLGFDPSEEKVVVAAEDIPVETVPDLAAKIEKTMPLFDEETIVQRAFALEEENVLASLFPPEELEKWTVFADSARPDIRLSKTLVSIAQEEVATRKGEYWPKISLLAGYGGGSTPYLDVPTTKFNNQLFQWAVGFSLNWTVFDGFSRERRIRKAKAEMSKVRYDAKYTLQKAHTQVRDELYRMEKSLAKYLTASASLKLAEETLQQAESQLSIGYTTIYDYLISVDGLIRSRTNFYEGQFELLTAYYALLHACGKEDR